MRVAIFYFRKHRSALKRFSLLNRVIRGLAYELYLLRSFSTGFCGHTTVEYSSYARAKPFDVFDDSPGVRSVSP